MHILGHCDVSNDGTKREVQHNSAGEMCRSKCYICEAQIMEFLMSSVDAFLRFLNSRQLLSLCSKYLLHDVMARKVYVQGPELRFYCVVSAANQPDIFGGAVKTLYSTMEMRLSLWNKNRKSHWFILCVVLQISTEASKQYDKLSQRLV